MKFPFLINTYIVLNAWNQFNKKKYFSKSRPYCLHMDDIMFKAPVEVGSLLYFNSQICYTQDNYVQTRVSAEVKGALENPAGGKIQFLMK